MAYIRKRERKDGTAIYQVRWTQGGRSGAYQTEAFGDEDGAAYFRGLVDAHGQQWPPGWVKGEGFVEEPAQPGDMTLVQWAHRYIENHTGMTERYRYECRRLVDHHFTLLQHTEASGRVVEATICNLTGDDVQAWIRAEREGERDPDNAEKWLRRPASPKSLRNRHGLLYSIVQAAVDADPPLRSKNACKGSKMPRLDDHIAEEMAFLERDEYRRIAEEIDDPDARDLADWLVGTGMRWGEATALQVRDIDLSRRTANVQRAWKRSDPDEVGPAYYLGPPKTKKARRVIALSDAQLEMLRRRLAGAQPESLVFTTRQGKAWRQPNFWRRRWVPAVEAAIGKGLMKRPRIHDLRHTHASWLIGARIPLPAIQVRLGHESITTTVDRYGHLVRELDAEIAAAVETAMTVPEQQSGNVTPLRGTRGA